MVSRLLLREPDSVARRSSAAVEGALLAGALGAQIFLSLHVALRAWPEVLVPSYLVGRGWRLYREIKFVHTPLFIEALAGYFRILGYSDATLRIAALGPALAAHVAIWRAGAAQGWRLRARVSSVLFLVVYFSLWDANAIWPEVAMAAFSIPILCLLSRGESRRGELWAGTLFGVLLLMKQTALFALIAAALWLLRRRPAKLPHLLLPAAALPAAVFGLFGLRGEGAAYWRWTVVVPLVELKGKIDLAPRASQLLFAAPAILPFLAWLFAPRRGDRSDRPDRALAALLVLGFAAMAFPRFEFVHLAAAVPLLAYGAGAVLEETEPGARRWLPATAVALTLGLGIAHLAADASGGAMTFWRSPGEDAAVAWLRRQADAPLFVYGPEQNLSIRSGRVPPGRLYCNPGLWYLYLVENMEERQIRTLETHPETIVLRGEPFPRAGAGARLEEFLRTRYQPAPGPGQGIVRLLPSR